MMRVLCGLLCLISVSISIAFSVCNVFAEEVIINDVRVEGLSRLDEDALLELLNIKVHEKLDIRVIREGIKRAFLTNQFDDIVVIQDDVNPSTIIVRATEKLLVEKIEIVGFVHLRKKEIESRFPIKRNDFFNTHQLNSALKKLKESLIDKGYVKVKIDSDVRYLIDKRTVRIKLTIFEGDPLTIRKLVIHGIDDPNEIDRIILKLRVFPGDIYDRYYIVKQLEKLRGDLKKEGYIRPAVGPFTFSDGVLTLNIKLGRKLIVTIKENLYFSDSRLKEDMLFLDAESVASDVIEEVSARIVGLYHKSGFAFVQVAPVIKENKDTVEILFFIHEGDQVYVDNITIEGNTIESEKIKDLLVLKEGEYFNPDMMDVDRQTIQEYYYAFGYPNIEVVDMRYEFNQARTGVHLYINIHEGSQILVGNIKFYGNKVVSDKELMEIIKIRPLDPYNEIAVSDSRFSIINLYKKKGYVDLTVNIERSFSRNRVFIGFNIDEKEQYYFGYTIVRGNVDVKTKVISRELVNKMGEPFDSSMLRKNTQKLYKLGLFSDVDYKVIDDTDNFKSVVLDVKESKAGAIEFGIGYGDYEKYRGSFDITYRNFFGLNRHGKMRTELTTISEKYILSGFEPWLYNFEDAYGPVSLRLDLIKERRTEKNIDTDEVKYKVSKYSSNANFEMNFDERIKGEMLYSLSQVDTYDVQDEEALSKEDTETLLISSLRPGIIFDSRNNPFNPGKGVLSGFSVEVASQYLLSETDYVKYVWYGNSYRRLYERIIGAVSLRAGLAEGFQDTEELPIVERFFLGGRNSVRGYTQDSLGPKTEKGNPTGGNVFLMNSLELRVNVWKSIGVISFLDGGNVWREMSDVNLSDYKFTVGIGLRYMTPVGPIRLDYGHKLDREEGESAGEIHFSIGHAF